MEKESRKRAAIWSTEEECLLIEECVRREDVLFGKMKGCGSGGKIGKIKESGWQEIVDKLNEQFISKKRDIVEVKKKYYNIKQRSKEKLDNIKRPKTGGGPQTTYTKAESLFVETMEGRPQIEGLPFGIDSDNLNILQVPVQMDSPIEFHFEGSKRLTALEEENITLDNQRLKLEIIKLKQETKNLESTYDLIELKKKWLKKQINET